MGNAKCLKKIDSIGMEFYPHEAANIVADAIYQLETYSNKLEWRVEELEKELSKLRHEYNAIVENIEALICNMEKEVELKNEKFSFIKKYKVIDDEQ